MEQIEKAAEWGSKMIEVRVRFWTNDLAPTPGMILPKNAWTSGMVVMASNKSHGIVPTDPLPFNSIADLHAVIHEALREAGVRLHLSNKDAKLMGE